MFDSKIITLKTGKKWRLKAKPLTEKSGNIYKIAATRKKLLIDEVGYDVYNFISKNTDILSKRSLIVSTGHPFNVLNTEKPQYKSIINLKKINDFKRINKFFEAVNSKLIYDGVFICSVETYRQRGQRLLKKFPPVFNWFYYLLDFIFKRIFPKLKITKKIYFYLTNGRNRVISKAETYGRLYSCGFKLVGEKTINGKLYFIARKTGKPYYDYHPTYGPIVSLRRVGKNRKIIKAYKLRTMHPYSEYLQNYVYEKNNLNKDGKFSNDFRINTIGKFMRKYWIDELPMLFNVLKLEMKIVGVRPLSEHYFNLYDEDLKAKRTKYKPGLIPPYYADLPETLEEIQNSERKYLDAYSQKPLITDWRYFWKAMQNIFIKKARSN